MKAVFPGASNAPVPNRSLDTPMDFGSMQAIGSGLGSGGMIVYDDTACVVAATAVLSRFLATESCGQCPPCKLGTAALAERFLELDKGRGDLTAVEEIQAWTTRVTDANRCGLGTGERALAAGTMRMFTDEVLGHLAHPCPFPRLLRLPKMVDWLPEAGRFVYDDTYFQWRKP